MKRILFSVFVIFTAILYPVAAQTAAQLGEFEQGIALAREGRFESARRVFGSLLNAAAANQFESQFLARLHYNLGTCELRLGESNRAATEFEAAIASAGGKYEKAFYALGMAHSELRNWNAAKSAFHRALLVNERNGEAWFDLGFVYLELNESDNAFVAFENAVRHKSSASAFALNNLGVISAQRGKTAVAVAYFEKALARSGGRLQLAKDNLEFTTAGAFAARP